MNVILRFNGPYDEAFDLVEEIRASGASVSWEPPDRERGDFLYDVAVNIIASGAVAVMESTVRSFLSRHKTASVELQQTADEDQDSADTKDDDPSQE